MSGAYKSEYRYPNLHTKCDEIHIFSLFPFAQTLFWESPSHSRTVNVQTVMNQYNKLKIVNKIDNYGNLIAISPTDDLSMYTYTYISGAIVFVLCLVKSGWEWKLSSLREILELKPAQEWSKKKRIIFNGHTETQQFTVHTQLWLHSIHIRFFIIFVFNWCVRSNSFDSFICIQIL